MLDVDADVLANEFLEVVVDQSLDDNVQFDNKRVVGEFGHLHVPEYGVT